MARLYPVLIVFALAAAARAESLFDVRQVATISDLPASGELVQIWVPLPRSADGRTHRAPRPGDADGDWSQRVAQRRGATGSTPGSLSPAPRRRLDGGNSSRTMHLWTERHEAQNGDILRRG